MLTKRTKLFGAALMALILVAVGCTASKDAGAPGVETSTSATSTSTSSPTTTPVPPTAAPSPTPTPFPADALPVPRRTLDRVLQLLPRDAIRPIYAPTFVQASDSDLESIELVIGVEINGDARAYPIRYLRTREIVNDTVGGVPILVTW